MKGFVCVTGLLASTAALAEGPTPMFEGGDTDIGGFAGLDVQGTRIWGKNTALVCGELGILFDHAISVGTVGCGSVTHIDAESIRGRADERLNLGFGGLNFRYHHALPQSPVMVGVGAMVGAGAVVLSEFDEDADGHYRHDRDDLGASDAAFVAVPEANVSVLLTRWMRVSAMVNYRVVQGVQKNGLGDEDFRGFAAGLGVHFGWF